MAPKENGTEPGEKKEDGAEGSTEGAPAPPVTLPMDIRQKLRKLERLEPKYSGNFPCLLHRQWTPLIYHQIC
jgi:hypothetical protein